MAISMAMEYVNDHAQHAANSIDIDIAIAIAIEIVIPFNKK